MEKLTLAQFEEKYGIAPVIDQDDKYLKVIEVDIWLNESIMQITFYWESHPKCVNKWAQEDGISFSDGEYVRLYFKKLNGHKHHFLAGILCIDEDNRENEWRLLSCCNTKYGVELTFLNKNIKYTERYFEDCRNV